MMIATMGGGVNRRPAFGFGLYFPRPANDSRSTSEGCPTKKKPRG